MPSERCNDWRDSGLSTAHRLQLLTALQCHAGAKDRRACQLVRELLKALGDPKESALPIARRWFQRKRMARTSPMLWPQTMRLLGLDERAAQLDKLLTSNGDFGIALRHGVASCCFNLKDGKTQVVPFDNRDGRRAVPGNKALQRLERRQQQRLALGSQPGEDAAVEQQRAAVVAAVREAGDVGESAAGLEARTPVLLGGEAAVHQQPLVFSCIHQKLKPHQVQGLQFLWNALVLDFQADADVAGGCMLAHHMGLGKTLQTIAFLSSYSLHNPDARSLLVVPKVVLHNWVQEFQKWLPRMPPRSPGLSVDKVFVVETIKDEPIVRKWHATPGAALVVTHQKFADWVLNVQRGRKPKRVASTGSGALEEQPGVAAAAAAVERSIGELLKLGADDVVVVDEAHVIKTETAQIRAALMSIETKRRVALTGYPLQNNLTEMYAMISWCDPKVVEDKEEWKRAYADPIMAGQLPNASAGERRAMNEALSVFHALTSGIVHRKGEDVLKTDLPQKQEVVIKLALTPTQHKVYQHFINESEQGRRSILEDHHRLKMLCDRPSSFRAYLEAVLANGQASLAAAAAAAGPGLAKPAAAPAAAAAAAAAAAQLAAAVEAAAGQPAAAEAMAAEEAAMDVGDAFCVDFDEEELRSGMSGVSAASGASAQQGGISEGGTAGEASSGAPSRLASGLGASAVQPAAAKIAPLASLGAAVAAAEAAAAARAGATGAAGGTSAAVAAAAVRAITARAPKPPTMPAALAQQLLDIIDAGPPEEFQTAHTSKLWAVEQLLRFCAAHDEKLMLVAESLDYLSKIEKLLGRMNLRLPDGRLARHCKIEGDTNNKDRCKLVRDFEGGVYQFFLISKAGTHGINLVSCRRIAVLEEPWNPVFNLQAIGRIFRYGQTQQTFVYRLSYNGTFQYNIYLRNVNKVALFRRVIDRQTVRSIRGEKDQQELSLYFYKTDDADAQSLKLFGKDPALAALLAADTPFEGNAAAAAAGRPGWRIVALEDHDKNLADDPSQNLTKEEKRRAAKQARRQWLAHAAAGPVVEGARVLTRSMRAKQERLRKVYGELSDDDDFEVPAGASLLAGPQAAAVAVLAPRQGTGYAAVQQQQQQQAQPPSLVPVASAGSLVQRDLQQQLAMQQQQQQQQRAMQYHHQQQRQQMLHLPVQQQMQMQQQQQQQHVMMLQYHRQLQQQAMQQASGLPAALTTQQAQQQPHSPRQQPLVPIVPPHATQAAPGVPSHQPPLQAPEAGSRHLAAASASAEAAAATIAAAAAAFSQQQQQAGAPPSQQQLKQQQQQAGAPPCQQQQQQQHQVELEQPAQQPQELQPTPEVHWDEEPPLAGQYQQPQRAQQPQREEQPAGQMAGAAARKRSSEAAEAFEEQRQGQELAAREVTGQRGAWPDKRQRLEGQQQQQPVPASEAAAAAAAPAADAQSHQPAVQQQQQQQREPDGAPDAAAAAAGSESQQPQPTPTGGAVAAAAAAPGAGGAHSQQPGAQAQLEPRRPNLTGLLRRVLHPKKPASSTSRSHTSAAHGGGGGGSAGGSFSAAASAPQHAAASAQHSPSPTPSAAARPAHSQPRVTPPLMDAAAAVAQRLPPALAAAATTQLLPAAAGASDKTLPLSSAGGAAERPGGAAQEEQESSGPGRVSSLGRKRSASNSSDDSLLPGVAARGDARVAAAGGGTSCRAKRAHTQERALTQREQQQQQEARPSPHQAAGGGAGAAGGDVIDLTQDD